MSPNEHRNQRSFIGERFQIKMAENACQIRTFCTKAAHFCNPHRSHRASDSARSGFGLRRPSGLNPALRVSVAQTFSPRASLIAHRASDSARSGFGLRRPSGLNPALRVSVAQTFSPRASLIAHRASDSARSGFGLRRPSGLNPALRVSVAQTFSPRASLIALIAPPIAHDRVLVSAALAGLTPRCGLASPKPSRRALLSSLIAASTSTNQTTPASS
jgi:hypothetical protein